MLPRVPGTFAPTTGTGDLRAESPEVPAGLAGTTAEVARPRDRWAEAGGPGRRACWGDTAVKRGAGAPGGASAAGGSASAHAEGDLLPVPAGVLRAAGAAGAMAAGSGDPEHPCAREAGGGCGVPVAGDGSEAGATRVTAAGGGPACVLEPSVGAAPAGGSGRGGPAGAADRGGGAESVAASPVLWPRWRPAVVSEAGSSSGAASPRWGGRGPGPESRRGASWFRGPGLPGAAGDASDTGGQWPRRPLALFLTGHSGIWMDSAAALALQRSEQPPEELRELAMAFLLPRRGPPASVLAGEPVQERPGLARRPRRGRRASGLPLSGPALGTKAARAPRERRGVNADRGASGLPLPRPGGSRGPALSHWHLRSARSTISWAHGSGGSSGGEGSAELQGRPGRSGALLLPGPGLRAAPGLPGRPALGCQ